MGSQFFTRKILRRPFTFLSEVSNYSRRLFEKSLAKYPRKQVCKCPIYMEGVLSFYWKHLCSHLQKTNYSGKIFIKFSWNTPTNGAELSNYSEGVKNFCKTPPQNGLLMSIYDREIIYLSWTRKSKNEEQNKMKEAEKWSRIQVENVFSRVFFSV